MYQPRIIGLTKKPGRLNFDSPKNKSEWEQYSKNN